MQGLEGRVAVVTGAGRGIGRLISRRFASEGAKVALLSRGEGPLREVEAELRDAGAKVAAIALDVADRAQVDSAFAQVRAELGAPQILVNCAQSWGSPDVLQRDMSYRPLEDVVDREWDHTLKTGLMGSLYCMVAALPSMRAAGWGRVINFYSPMAAQAAPLLGPYNCAKAAILALTARPPKNGVKTGSPSTVCHPLSSTTECGTGSTPSKTKPPVAQLKMRSGLGWWSIASPIRAVTSRPRWRSWRVRSPRS